MILNIVRNNFVGNARYDVSMTVRIAKAKGIQL